MPNLSTHTTRHLFWLVLGLAVPAVAALLVVVDGERIALCFLPQFTFPTTCLSRNLFGINCPGCGLTRSIVSLVHGRWADSWHMHRLGFVVFALIVAQVPYRAWRLTRRKSPEMQSPWSRNLWWVGLAAALVLNRLWDVFFSS